MLHRHRTHHTWAVLTLVILLLSLVMGPAVSGQTAPEPGARDESTLPPLAVPSTPLPDTEGPSGEGPWVVRAYYADRQMVNDLAAWREPWEVHHDQGYVVLDVTEGEYRRLLDSGFRLEIDERLTAQLNQPPVSRPGQITAIPGFPCYQTVEETFDTAQAIVADYPALATWTDIGDSWEKTQDSNSGHDMMVLRLTNSAIPGPKPKLFAMASIHAREYTPAELATRFAQYLVDNYDVDPDVTWLLDYHEIHLILQANPDGRKKAEDPATALWRKNTNNAYCTDTDSRGADLNRNFEFQWGCCGGSSGFSCNELYRGPSAASEPETQAIQAYVRAQFPDQRATELSAAAPITSTGVFLDLHSFQELVLWPWCFSGTPTANGAALQTLGRKFAYFNHYTPQRTIDLYVADGCSMDFAYGDLGLASFTFEMGTAFSQDCATFENTILPDNLSALMYAAKVARTPYMTPAGPDVLDLVVTPEVAALGQTVRLSAVIDDTRYSAANGTEPHQNIAAAEYYVDVPPWVTATTPNPHPMAAEDGAFDGPTEGVNASIDTAGLSEGRHIIYVRGQDAHGNWGAVSAIFLRLVSTPTAEFSSDGPVDLGDPVTFTNLSTGTPPLNYYWDLGDELGTSSASDPSYTYRSSGTFSVTLVVTNSWGSDSVAHPVTVLASCVPVEIIDVESNSPVRAGDALSFTATVSGQPPVTYTWDFGDNTAPRTGVNLSAVSHAYDAAGSYPVRLEVANACPSTDEHSITVSVNPRSQPSAPLWNKQVYVNGTLTNSMPITVWPGDTIQIVDQVYVSSAGTITFALTDTWTDGLLLDGWTHTIGHVTPTSQALSWEVESAQPDVWHILTKTFRVVGDTWTLGHVAESLWVENASSQLDERLIILARGGAGWDELPRLYLPMVTKSN
jgi:carboxypeptidase T